MAEEKEEQSQAEEVQQPQAEEVQQSQAAEVQVKELRLEIRIDQEQNQHLEKLSNYAALEGLIPSDHRGNKTAWLNYCLALGEEALKQYVYKKRGF